MFCFLLRSVGRSDLSAGPEQKKKHHPGCVFFCSGPGERQGKEKPRWAPARGQSKKKTPPRVFEFFCCGPGERQGKEKPVGRRHGARAKKNTTQGVFFFLRPRVKAGEGEAPARGQSKKKTPPARGFSFPGLSPGPEPKKNTLGGVLFFAAAPRGRSLTHCGPGWRCLPLAGVFFFFCCGPARTRVVFVFLLWPRPDAHSLTVGWGDFGKARVVFFFCCGPAGSF